MKMKAVVIYEAGGPEQLKVETKEIPKVKEGWTLVKIKGFGINRSEIFRAFSICKISKNIGY